MRVTLTSPPDIWYDEEDLTPDSFAIIRSESVTCCGFLGGDTILIVKSGYDLADLLELYRPVLPYEERITNSDLMGMEIVTRHQNIISDLRTPDWSVAFKEGDFQRLNFILTKISSSLWYAGQMDPFRFSLKLIGPMSDLITDQTYLKKLVLSLSWWFEHEASAKEKRIFCRVRDLSDLQMPHDADLIVKALNLYNHGAYELAGLI
ncbi:MAG TPA: hypothetical protein VN372_15735 [Methanospirillum sp.]|nr:hypothetical protein [Methanospirillum sp.]